MAPGDVSPSCEDQHLFFRVRVQVGGDVLGHGFVPGELNLAEPREVGVLALVLGEYLLQQTVVGLVAVVVMIRQFLSEPRADTVDALVADGIGQLLARVEGDDRDMVYACITHDGPVQAVVVTPAVEVVGTSQHFRLVDAAGDKIVQNRLEARLYPFHAERQPVCWQGLECGELQQVVGIAGMGFRDIHQPFLRDLLQRLIQCRRVGDVYHRGRDTARGGRRIGTDGGDAGALRQAEQHQGDDTGETVFHWFPGTAAGMGHG